MRKIEKIDDDIVGKFIKINEVSSIIDQEIYSIEQDNYNTEDIGGSDSDSNWNIIDIDNEDININFTYKIWHLQIDNEDIGNKTYKGNLTFNIPKGTTSININKTSIE